MTEQSNQHRDFANLHPGLRWPSFRLPQTALPVLTCLALLLLLFSRRPEMFLNPQFWAEDGSVFFLQADQYGARALVMPYGGYHHLLLRLIAAATAPLNATVLPTGYFHASMVITMVLAAALFSPRIDLSYRPACVLALGLIPHTGEVFGNLTNLQWLSALGLVWLLLARDPTGLWQQAGDSLLTLVLGSTGVFSVLFTPLFLYRALCRRTPAGWIITSLLCCTALLQLHAIARAAAATVSADTLPVWRITGLRLVVDLCLPMNRASQLPDALLGWLGFGGLALLLVAGCWSGRQRETRLFLAACCVLVLAGTLFRFHHGPAALDGSNGDRYFFLPKLLAAWLLIQGLATRGWRRWACAVACVSLLATSLNRWRYERIPNLHWVDYARQIEAGEGVSDIPINPGLTFSHPGRHHHTRWQHVPPIRTKP